MQCDICGGYFLEDFGKCTCDGKEIRKIKKKNKQLQAENKEWKDNYEKAMEDNCQLSREIMQLQAENEKLRDALLDMCHVKCESNINDCEICEHKDICKPNKE